MKKSVFIAAFGLAVAAYGQGTVNFTSYSSNDSTGTKTLLFGTTTSVPSTFTADLFYALGTVSDPVVTTDQASVGSAPSSAFTDLHVSGASFSKAYGGFNYFDYGNVTIPNYVSGAITFEVVVTGPGYYGRSGSFTASGLNAAPAPINALGDAVGGGQSGGQQFPTTYVAAVVPEPTTLALAGLGGLASLIALRRKQA